MLDLKKFFESGLLLQLAKMALLFGFVSAALIGGHIWRMPLSIVQFVDATFIFSKLFVFGVKFTIAFLMYKFTVATFAIPFRKERRITVLEYARIVFLSLVYAVGIFLAVRIFAQGYLGFTFAEVLAAVGITFSIAIVLLISSDKLVASATRVLSDIKNGVIPESDENPDWKRTSGGIRALTVLCALSAFGAGELHMSYLLGYAEARRATDGDWRNAETYKIIGVASNGVLQAYYSGKILQNKKEIVFVFQGVDGLGAYQASHTSALVPQNVIAAFGGENCC